MNFAFYFQEKQEETGPVTPPLTEPQRNRLNEWPKQSQSSETHQRLLP